jgi:HlyD family secretion protein
MDTTTTTEDSSQTFESPHALKPERIPPWLKWGVPGVLLAIVLAFAYFHRKPTGNPYRTDKITRGGLHITVTATGTLQPTNEVDVGSELSGTIRKINVDFNDKVTAGQVLAELDTTRLSAQVQQMDSGLAAAKARVAQTEATLKESETTLERLKKVRELSNNKLPSQQDMDSAEAAVARGSADVSSAKAAVSQALATLDGARTDLGKAQIRSPINGVVLLRSVDQGQTVAATMQAPVLFTLAQDLKVMQLKVDVDEADVGKVQIGQHATFTVDAYPDRHFNARITQVHFAPSNQKSASSTSTTTASSTGVVTYETELEVDNSDLFLRPGMTATAVITVQEVDDALLAPNAALRFVPAEVKARIEQMRNRAGGGGGLTFMQPRPNIRPRNDPNSPLASMRGMARVWVIGPDGKPQMISFRAGTTDGQRTQIISVGNRMSPDMKPTPANPDDLKAGTELIVDVNETAQRKP